MVGDRLIRKPPESRYLDPEERLAGKCMTCRTIVGCFRREAAPPGSAKGLGAWGDLWSTECAECKARVFLMPVLEFQKTVGLVPEKNP